MKLRSLPILIWILYILQCTSALGQSSFGNEWIDVNKTYVKIKVASDGIYRIKYETLLDAGFLTSGIKGQDLQLLNYGKEMPIYVSDNAFGDGDYVEFYGERNTLGLDTTLYQNWKKDLFNTKYNSVNDTNAYFLTLNPNTNNLRYAQVNPDFNANVTVAPYYMHDELNVFSNFHYKRKEGEIRFSSYESSEGFGSILQKNSKITIPSTKIYSNGPNAHLSFRTGQNNLYSVSEITFNSQEIFNDTIEASANTQFDFDIPLTKISTSNTLEISSVYGTADQHRYAYISLLYPRDWDFDGSGMKIFKQLKSAERRKANIINVKNPGSGVILYDPKNKLRYSTSSSNGIVTIITNPVNETTDYVLASEVGGTIILDNVSLFVPKKFEDFGQDYIILTNKFLHDQGEDFVQQYADYRSSVDGGNHTVSIIDVQDVYDQFGFGIDRHFLAIKNMTNYIKNTWQKSKFLFIIGKGLEYPYFRSKEDVINHNNKEFFIPTYGFSGSDVYMTSYKNTVETMLAVGRLAATNPDDIKNYLDKVIAYESAVNNPQTVDEKYWQKKVLHLGGGKNDSEQFQIRTGLEGMASIISDTIWGLEVHPFYKNSGSAVSYAVNEEIKNLFETGVGIINFFGHSANTTWDFSLKNPRDYNNYGKYPFINSFGCYSGNLHSTAKGISEAFVLEKDKGSICFFASTSTAFIGDLSNYGVQFFKKLSDQWRYHSYGEVIQAVQKESQGLSYNLLSQLTLHGDPSIKPYFPYGPDYTFDPSSFSTEPKSIGSNDEDAIVEFDIANLGSFIQDSIALTFYHILPSGRVADTIVLKVPGIANKYHVSVPIKKYNEESIGKNKLLGYIDLKNNIKEVPNPEAENNNSIVIEGQEGFEFFVSDNFAQIVYPPNFAMINTKDHFVLKASTISVPLLNSMYVFEIDTTAYFNSPIKESTTVESKGGLLTYSPKMALVDGRVYYWRVSPQKTAETDYKWNNASFAYLPQEEEGWNQSHFFQFMEDDFIDLELSEDTERKFEFGKDIKIIKLTNKLWDPNDKPGYSRNNVLFASSNAWQCMDSGIGIILNNDINFWEPQIPPGGKFGSLNTTTENLDVYAFPTNTESDRKKVIDFIENQVTDGKYISFYTIQNTSSSDYHPQDWENDEQVFGKSIFSVLEDLGAVSIRSLNDKGSVPYIFQAKKGGKVYGEKIANDVYDYVEINSYLTNLLNNGKLNSPTIENSKKIKNLKFLFSDNSGQKEKSWVNIIDNKTSQFIDSLIFAPKAINQVIDNGIVLQSLQYDSLARTSPQLDYWRISYEPLPDAAISYVSSSPDFSLPNINQGETFKLTYEVTNTNFTKMDSILVKYTYFGSDNISQVNYKKLKNLGAGETIQDQIQFTLGLSSTSGIRIEVEINPEMAQPELYSFNNILTIQLDIAEDDTNPLMDVYFDGVRILDGDIVSPKPHILVTLRDDNPYLPINDAKLFELKLDTGRNQFITIPIPSDEIQFKAATGADPKAELTYSPTLRDGDYTLSVQAKDATGNLSGSNPQMVQFRVIEKQSVSNVLNYPNPFSTSTQFIFTLTGEQVPESMSISIMTMTGKVVREITQEELGPLKIGQNRTEFKWDGTDEYGSKLANGVYLYKVNVRDSNNKAYDSFNNASIDSYFKDGFGKMVILR